MRTIEHPLSKKRIPEYATGVISPVYTPALEGGRLDPRGMANLIDLESLDPNITTLFVRCGGGRMYTYTKEETKQAIEVTMDRCGDKKYTVFGTFGIFDGEPDHRPDPKQFLDESIELSIYAQEKGATAAVLIVPWALGTETGEAMEDKHFEYYKTVCEAVSLPVLLYNTPQMPAEFNLTPRLLTRIRSLPNMAGAKISTGNLAWMTELELATTGSDFALISGHEGVYLPCLSIGVLGVIGQGCNIYPHILRKVLDDFLAGDLQGAREAQMDVLRGLSNFDGYGNSTSGLAYLKSKGLDIESWDKSGVPICTPEDVVIMRKGLDPIMEKYLSAVS